MKTLTYINTFLLITLIVSGILGYIEESFWLLTMILPVIIGLYQGLVGVVLFIMQPTSVRFQLYVGGLILFISSCYLPTPNLWMVLPIPLLLYFTFMIHTVHQKKHEYKTFKTI